MPKKSEVFVSLSPTGKKRLTEAFDASGLSMEALASLVGVTRPTIRALVLDKPRIGKQKPAWSSPKIAKLCKILSVPLWEVTSGIGEDHRRLIRALEELRALDADRYAELLEQTIEAAGDKAARASVERGSALDAPMWSEGKRDAP